MKGEKDKMGKIEVIGLGAGDIDQLPLGIYKKLMNTTNICYIRTKEHPLYHDLVKEGVTFHTFDHYYEAEEQFQHVYERIAIKLLQTAQKEQVLYAVPGHPMLAEQTVQLLLEQSEVQVDIIGGQSYLDDLFTSLHIDPIEGFQFVDGTSFHPETLNYEDHLLFCQVYDRFIASNVKLALLEDLPANYPVTVIDAAGSKEEVKRTVPLSELDHDLAVSNLTSLYIPPVPKKLLHHKFTILKSIIHVLRGPDGCSWDRKQTHETLRPFMIEETYELMDAIDQCDDNNIVEELGDVLLQVMLHSQIGEDAGYFTINDVIKSITDKMIHRHPQVFSKTDSSPEMKKSWDQLKEEEGKKRNSILDGIPGSLPSLAKAKKLQTKAAKVGFHWNDVEGIWAKLAEELQEVKEAIQLDEKANIEAELGDVLFVLANIARYYDINPEIALNHTNRKFMNRFQYIEKKIEEENKNIESVPLTLMNRYWDEAKERE